MNNNTKIIAGIVIIVALGLSFYSGMRHGGNNVAAAAASRMANFQGRGTRGGDTAGNIISADATSITVGLRAGGSKIVFFSPATSISTMASGTPADLLIGKQVIVSGTANQDGSVNATMIQVR